MSLAFEGARGSLVTVAAQMANLGLRVISLVVLARLLAPEDFGLVAIVTSISTIVMTIVFFGLPMATAQATNLSRRAHSGLLIVNSTLGLLLGFALFLAAPAVGSLYGEPHLVTIVQWLSLVPLLNGINVQFRQSLIGDLRFGPLTRAELTAQALGVVVAIVLALRGFGWQAIVAQLVTTAVAQLTLTALASRWWPGPPGRWRSEVLPIAHIGAHLFGTTLVQNVSKGAIVPILGLVSSPNALGQFDRAQQLAVMPINLTVDQLQRVVVPILSRLRDEPARMLAYMQRFQLVGAYGTATLSAVAAALAPHLVEVVLGPGWRTTGLVLQILAVGAVFRSASQSMQWLFIARRRTGPGLRFAAWSLPAVSVVSLLGLPWGVVGVAVANTAAWMLYWPIAATRTGRATGFPPRALLSSAARGTFMFALPLGAAASLVHLLPVVGLPALVVGLGFAALGAVFIGLCVGPVRRDLAIVWRTARLALQRRSTTSTESVSGVDESRTSEGAP